MNLGKMSKQRSRDKDNGSKSSKQHFVPGTDCYCNGGRDVGKLELFCNSCGRWFHGSCLRHLKNFSSSALPFMVCYTFSCEICSPNRQESWIPRQANFSHMCVTALANLTWRKKQKVTGLNPSFSLQKEIIPFIDENWIWLTSMPRRVKLTWHQTLMRTLLKETDLFYSEAGEESEDRKFGLMEEDLGDIGPRNELIKQLGRKPPTLAPQDDPAEVEGPKTRGAKRKAESQASNAGKKSKGSDSTLTKFSGYALPVEHPFNRDGYRYFLAEPDMHAPNRLEFDEKEETAGKPIPAYMYRVVRPALCELSSHDRAPQLRLHDDYMTVTGEKGYSVVRGSHGVSSGCWYYEVSFLEQPHGSHVRIGWSQGLGCLQAPVGYDRFSYSWRSRKGTKFHGSIGKHYSQEFRSGDVLGCYIELPPPKRLEDVPNCLPSANKDLPLIKFKSHFYYEEKDEVQKTLKELKPRSRSRMIFYRNGVNQGVAFTDVNDGTYYPALSLFKNATLRANFGPKFRFPPIDVPLRPMCSRADEIPVEQCLADILYFVENEGKLTLE